MNKEQQKRVAAIHDLSGFGKCSLTVARPILSAAGIETSALPTAILSTHTGGILGYTYRDLTEDMRPFMKHWKELDIRFDAVYSGFLGSFEQLDIVKEFFSLFKPACQRRIRLHPVEPRARSVFVARRGGRRPYEHGQNDRDNREERDSSPFARAAELVERHEGEQDEEPNGPIRHVARLMQDSHTDTLLACEAHFPSAPLIDIASI